MKKYRLVVGMSALMFCTVAAGQEASWTDNIKLGGDLRYRHELVKATGQPQRNRDRIRARLSFQAKVNDQTDIGFQIASGGSDPISSNQTIGDGFQRKPFGLDLAYFAWHPAQVSGLGVIGGKMKNPFLRPGSNELIWDNDLTPEGLAIQYNGKTGSFGMFANAAYLWVQERSKQKDSGLLGGQLGVTAPLPMAKSSVTGGISYYDYLNAKGWPTFYDPTNAFGNTVDASKLYAENFHIVEGFAEVGFEAGALPIVLAGDYVNNRGASSNDQGWIAGFIVGKAKNPGSWQLSYMYRSLRKDAVVGAFNDSDFGGGGTDNKGHVARAAYQLAKGVQCGATYFHNNVPYTGGSTYHRLQVDAVFSF